MASKSGNPAKTKKSLLKLEREKRRAEVERLWSEGYTVEGTAAELKVCPRTIKNDRERTLAIWKDRQLSTRAKRVLLREQELELIKREAIAAWFRPEEEILIEKTPDGQIASIKIKEKGQNGRFLEIALKANDELRKLHGDNAEQGSSGVTVNVNVNADAEDRRTRLARLAQRIGIDPAVIEGSATESSINHKSNGHSQNGHAKGNGKPL